jgi:hypothetical protein
MFAKRKQTIVAVWVLLAMALGVTACGRLSRATTKAPQYFEHTVRYSGETLSLIAKWYTGEAKNWPILADRNPDVSPNNLRIGALILIPRDMVVNTEPMPRSYISSSPSKGKKIPAAKTGVSKGRDRDSAGSGEAEAADLPDGPTSPPTSGTTSAAPPAPSQHKGDGLELFGPKE